MFSQAGTQIVEELEAKVEQLSRESTHTARAIAEADTRAADAHAAMFEALREQQAAEERSAAAEARVSEAVALRLRSMGADRAQWPEAARKGVEEAEYAAAAAGARVRELEGQLDTIQREVDQNAAQQARWKVSAVPPGSRHSTLTLGPRHKSMDLVSAGILSHMSMLGY